MYKIIVAYPFADYNSDRKPMVFYSHHEMFEYMESMN